MSDKELNNSEILPFSEKPQLAVLGFCLQNKTFFLFLRTKLEARFFINTLTSKVWTALCEYYDKFQEFPTIETLIEWPSISTEDQVIKNRINLHIKLAIAATRDYSEKWISDRIVEWLKVHCFSSSLERAAMLYNRGDFQNAFAVASEGMRKVDSIVLDPNSQYDPSNWQADFQESTVELENALTFGNSIVDSKLNPSAKKGSLLLGDSTVLLAPVNIGKSTCLITVMAHNMLNGKDILYLNHEGRTSDLRDKLWMCLLGMTRDELYNYVAGAGSDPEVYETIENLTKFLSDRICWVPCAKAGLSIEEVDAIIRTKIEEKIHKTGRGFDMLADDYPALLTSRRNQSGKLEMRHETGIIYAHFTQLALEFKMHSLSVIQTNRQGSKVNRGTDEDTRLLTPEDVAEAFGPIQTATNIISINRSPTAMAKKLITYYICKSRSSEVGHAIICKEDFSRAMTHNDKPGSAIWYRGTARLTDSDRVEDFFRNFAGREVAPSAMIGVEGDK